jgi:hypothetical protein
MGKASISGSRWNHHGFPGSIQILAKFSNSKKITLAGKGYLFV